MNSRQKRKAHWAETHEAPFSTYWVKTSAFGKIGDCSTPKYKELQEKNKMKMRNLRNELIAFDLWSKHTGSQKHSKLRAALKQRVGLYKDYQNLVANYMEAMKDVEPEVVEAEPVTE